MTYEESALLAAIASEPVCDLHRLAYADWLQENKEDGEERGAAIRRGVKKPKWRTFPEGEGAYIVADAADEVRARSISLARGYPGIQWQTYKGMIGACICTWESWVSNGGAKYAMGDRLVAKNWIPEVVLKTRPDYICHSTSDYSTSGIRGGWSYSSVMSLEGRERRHTIRDGENTAEVIFHAEWPTVSRWIFPELIQGIRWTFPDVEPWNSDMPAPSIIDGWSCQQVGTIVKTAIGRSGVLVTPIDVRGMGCVRSDYK